MAATSASHIIWFIAAVLAAAAISGVMIASVSELADKLEQQGNISSRELSFDISIENDITMVPYNSSTTNLSIYIKNTGSEEIYYSGANYTFVLLLSGGNYTGDTHHIPVDMEVVGAGSVFLPGRTMRLVYQIPSLYSDQQYHMRILASEHAGVGDATNFRISQI